MSSTSRRAEAAPTPSPVPRNEKSSDASRGEAAAGEGNAPLRLQQGRSGSLPSPKLRLHFEDLTHDGTRVFLKHVPDPYRAFDTGLLNIVKSLYSPPPHHSSSSLCHKKGGKVHFEPSIPPTQSITLVVHDFPGVAYTFGLPADSNQKEIHFSLPYIAGRPHIVDPAAELVGVIVHELVHCYQHTAPADSDDVPRPPGGLIEGIADFVRLKANLAPPHWKRPANSADLPKSWDSGYDQTAFFLEWLEHVRVGAGAIGMLNDRLLREGYIGEEDETERGRKSSTGRGFWAGLFGVGVLQLWKEYGEHIDRTRQASTRN